jgi:hypothetical protein
MGVSGQRHAPAALYHRGKDLRYPLDTEAGWAPDPVWTQRLEENSSVPIGDRTPIVQPVVRHYTDWATAAPMKTKVLKNSNLLSVLWFLFFKMAPDDQCCRTKYLKYKNL